MKRTTVFLDEQLERELQAFARRQRRPTAALVREAVERYIIAVRGSTRERLGFIGVGRSGHRDTAERHEELLWEDEAKGRATRVAAPGSTARAASRPSKASGRKAR